MNYNIMKYSGNITDFDPYSIEDKTCTFQKKKKKKSVIRRYRTCQNRIDTKFRYIFDPMGSVFKHKGVSIFRQIISLYYHENIVLKIYKYIYFQSRIERRSFYMIKDIKEDVQDHLYEFIRKIH